MLLYSRIVGAVLLLAAGSALARTHETPEDCASLYRDGQALMKSGRYGTARVTFQTLLAVYPECTLAKSATRLARTAAARELAEGPRVKAVHFENFQGVTADEIVRRLHEREAALRVTGPYDPRDVDEAKSIVQEMLAERGIKARVEAEARPVKHYAEVSLRMVKE